MRLVSVGTFLLPVRFSLPAMLDGGRDRLAAAVAAEFSEFTTLVDAPESELLLDFHRSRGAARMSTALFAGVTKVPGLGTIQLYLSSLGAGFVVAELTVPDDLAVDLDDELAAARFKEYERPLSHAVDPLVKEWGDRAAAAADAAIAEPRPAYALPACRLLWWHRIAQDPPEGKEFAAAKWYGERAELADGMECMVGNGFSYTRGAAHALPDVIEGLRLATEQWLIVDEAKRMLTKHLVELSQTRSSGLVRVDKQYEEVLHLTEEVTLRNLVLAEETRYLANARVRVKDAAARAWNIADESAQLEERTVALRDLFGLHRERITSNRDDRRNRYIFVFTGLTLVQAALVWYDFLTEDDVIVAANPRPVISYAILGCTVVILVGALAFGPLRRLVRQVDRVIRGSVRSAR